MAINNNKKCLDVIEKILNKINEMQKDSLPMASESDYSYICALDEIEEFVNSLKAKY